MAEEQASYGYETDEVAVSPFVFGLNAGKTFLKKFEWMPNGGERGAEMEALEIIFNINGKEKSYRQFPVKEAFVKGSTTGEKTSDPKAPEFIEAVKDFNAIMTHVAHAFMPDDVYRKGMARPFADFKEFCTVFKSLLPRNTPEIPLDIFMQWQWQPSKDQNRTFLEIPKKMKYGKWLCPAQAGKWKEVIQEGAGDNVQDALFYYDEGAGIKMGEDGITKYYNKIHPFKKNGWFMKQPFAKMQGTSSTTNNNTGGNSSGNSGSNTPAPESAAQNTSTAPVSTW